MWPDPRIAIVLLLAYVALEWLGFMHEHDGIPVTPWSPGHGVMLAAIIIGGAAYGAVFFVGVLLAELIVLRTTLPLPVVLFVSAIVAGTYTVVAQRARPFLRHDRDVFLTRDIMVLFAAGLAGATIVSALLCAALLSIEHFDLSDIARTAAPLVLGDLIGIVVVTPLLLRAYLVRDRLISLTRGFAIELGIFILAVTALLVLATWPGIRQPTLFHLLFLPIVVAAVRHGLEGACLTLVIVQLVLVALLHFHGVDLSRFTEYQILMLVLTLTGLVVGALVSERRQSDLVASRTSQRLQDLQAEAARAARLNVVNGMASALAHEINQPATAARAFARSVQELLRSPTPDHDRMRTNVTAMIEQIDHAAAVISRMREFLRRGKPKISTIDLALVLSEAVSLAKPLATMRQIALDLETSEQLPQLWGDRIQIQQVVINLIRNSVDAITDAGIGDGRIVVSAVQAGPHIEVRVRDNGPGIAPAQAEALFEPLTTTRQEGIGLGLSICETIVESHGGRIWLAASAPGHTEFRFTIPTGSTPSRETP